MGPKFQEYLHFLVKDLIHVFSPKLISRLSEALFLSASSFFVVVVVVVVVVVCCVF
jgi:hypothetical protein